MRHLLHAGARGLAQWAAGSYVAGPQLENALRVCRRHAGHGMRATVGYWNTRGEDPQAVAANYLQALRALCEERLDCYLSIKAPALGNSPERVAAVAEAAAAAGIGVHFDALQAAQADRMFELLQACARRPVPLGCTLPGRWRRSLADADRAVALGVRPRIVKGEWPDPASPSIDLRRGFLDVVDRLAGRVREAAVATHDAELARQALRRLRAAGTTCELELLFGLPLRAALRIAQDERVPVRLYVPFGQAWLPYCVAQARLRPRILWWLARDAMRLG